MLLPFLNLEALGTLYLEARSPEYNTPYFMFLLNLP